MPKFDKTGPRGLGSKTGRGLGPCNGFTNCSMFGGDRGFGRFWRFGTQITPKDEKKILGDAMATLQTELKAVQTRLDELKKK